MQLQIILWLDLTKPAAGLHAQIKSWNPFYSLTCKPHSSTISRYTIDGAIDSQVWFHRQSFADPVKPQRSTTGSMEPLMGTNKAAGGVKIAPDDCLVLPGWLWQFLFPTEDIYSTAVCLLTFGFPPTPFFFIPDIPRVEKTITKPAVWLN